MFALDFNMFFDFTTNESEPKTLCFTTFFDGLFGSSTQNHYLCISADNSK